VLVQLQLARPFIEVVSMRERIEQYCYTRKDFTLDWYSGSGAGGQHRNKHQNCLRLTHIPSGITVTAADGRDRPANLRRAFDRLRPKLET
jgi:protein subunit release factor A